MIRFHPTVHQSSFSCKRETSTKLHSFIIRPARYILPIALTPIVFQTIFCPGLLIKCFCARPQPTIFNLQNRNRWKKSWILIFASDCSLTEFAENWYCWKLFAKFRYIVCRNYSMDYPHQDPNQVFTFQEGFPFSSFAGCIWSLMCQIC